MLRYVQGHTQQTEKKLVTCSTRIAHSRVVISIVGPATILARRATDTVFLRIVNENDIVIEFLLL